MTLQQTANLENNYERFIKRVQAKGVVWGLKSDSGWAVCPSNESKAKVYLFWSDKAYAQRHCVDEWTTYQPEAIPLVTFEEAWLPGMLRDGHIVGAQFDAHLHGLELSPSLVARDLASRL
jgi:hypothetical protein